MRKGRPQAPSDDVIAILVTNMVLGLPRAEGMTISKVHPLP